MTSIIHHLVSLARLLFASLPLDIPTTFSIAELRQRLGSLPFAYGLAMTWEGPDHFRVETQTGGAPYRGSAIAPIIELRIVEQNGLGSLRGNAALPVFPRSVMMIILLAFALFAVGVITGSIPSDRPTQALPIIGLALSMLEIVHLAVLRSVRTTLALLGASIGVD